MGKNPLDPPSDGGGGWIGQGPRMTEEDLRQWASEKNQFGMRIGADWWYFVEKVQQPDGAQRWEVVKREGMRAIIARLQAGGSPYHAFRPQPDEAAAIHAKVRQCIDEGMTQAEFNALVDAGRI